MLAYSSHTNLLKKEIRIWNSENQCCNKNQQPWDAMCTNFQTKRTTLTFWAQIWILASEFQKYKSGFGISTCNMSCVPIFSQNGKHLIFRHKFEEIAQLRTIFWLKYCPGCCRELGGGWNELGVGRWSWVKVEMSRVEVDGAGWSWMELDGAGLTWMHGLVIPIFNWKLPWLEQFNEIGKTFILMKLFGNWCALKMRLFKC